MALKNKAITFEDTGYLKEKENQKFLNFLC
jgi:hypothetical protein